MADSSKPAAPAGLGQEQSLVLPKLPRCPLVILCDSRGEGEGKAAIFIDSCSTWKKACNWGLSFILS